MNKENYILEAKKITRYLLSESVGEEEQHSYVQAMCQLDLNLNDYQTMLWESMLKSSWRMACIDAGLALKDPGNVVRRKIFTMLAILEASPKYTKFFLSDHFSFLYYFKLGFIGCRSIVRAIVGILIIKYIQLRCP